MTEPNKVALVTGSAVRVGRAIAIALADAGHRVWVHHRGSADAARALVAELGDRGLGPVHADLGLAADRERLVATVLAPDGPGTLDLLVNSAASFERGEFLARDDADLERVLAVNLVAPVSLCRHLAPALRTSPHGPGSIVNVADLAGHHPWRGYLDHCVAKAGLRMATRALALELAPIRVNAVSPGTVLWPDDDRWAAGSEARRRVLAGIPLGRIGRPEDVAEAVLFLARSEHVTGIDLPVDGGRLAGNRGSDGA